MLDRYKLSHRLQAWVSMGAIHLSPGGHDLIHLSPFSKHIPKPTHCQTRATGLFRPVFHIDQGLAEKDGCLQALFLQHLSSCFPLGSSSLLL